MGERAPPKGKREKRKKFLLSTYSKENYVLQ
jgi:hypothetical protein